MRQLTIRKLMLVIAGVGVALGGSIELAKIDMDRGSHCSRTGECASNMRNVVLGTLGYLDGHGTFPSGTWPNPSLSPEHRLSWCATVLPYLDNPERFDELEKDQPWDGEANIPLAGTRMGVLRCPDVDCSLAGGIEATPYIGIAGVGTDSPILPHGHPRAGIFGYDRRTRLADIKDGTAFTMVLAESERVVGPWLAGGPATVRGLDPGEQPYIGPGRQFGGMHSYRSIVNVAFADGSVRGISESVNPRVFEALSTIAGGENLPPDSPSGW